MRISENWLREWVNPDMKTEAIAHTLTMAGLEVDSVTDAAGDFTGVVVGEVLSANQHPNADKLSVCKVTVGEGEPLDIVCGAPNVRQGLKVACAKVGAVLPGGFKIKKAKLRGEPSMGMLCSEKELGFENNHAGIMELPLDAPVGKDLRAYFDLDDKIIEVDLTPNRGDCLSIKGVARELGALLNMSYQEVDNPSVESSSNDDMVVELAGQSTCAHYCGRVIKGLDMTAPTPIWMAERLRRAGLRPRSLVVDVTNYVMLELGQPMHAFDLDKIDEKIVVREAKEGETLILLDEQEVVLKKGSLVIADKSKPLAIAGVMGGLESSVTDDTKAIFLESAYFAPANMAGVARQYNLSTDSSHRFERGVAIPLQREAIERATSLLLSLAGGDVGPVVDVSVDAAMPMLPTVPFHLSRANQVLGLSLDSTEVESYFNRLGLNVLKDSDTWQITVPPHRYDINIEVDLIEEVARVYGYDNIPEAPLVTSMKIEDKPETEREPDTLREVLRSLGYHEAISYSFICPKKHQLVYDVTDPIDLVNPISDELAQMRQGLWVGLLNGAQYNQARQQSHFKLFEIGLCFEQIQGRVTQTNRIAGLATGKIAETSWAEPTRHIDFYDMKGDIECLLGNRLGEVHFETPSHPPKALHPGMSAVMTLNGKTIGYIGMLHPAIQKAWDLSGQTMLFELDLESVSDQRLPLYKKISKFPEINRDIALLVDEKIEVGQLIAEIWQNNADSLLQSVCVFDVYQGDNIEKGKKSIALGLKLQHPSRTLVDAEVNDFMDAIIKKLGQRFDTSLRE